MKRFVLLVAVASTLLPIVSTAQATPAKTNKTHAQIAEMCKHKEIRLMLLHELTCTPERKLEAVKQIQKVPEARETWDHNLDQS